MGGLLGEDHLYIVKYKSGKPTNQMLDSMIMIVYAQYYPLSQWSQLGDDIPGYNAKTVEQFLHKVGSFLVPTQRRISAHSLS